VPSCPGWNADDLLWHLGEVQWFWAAVVREDVTGERAEELKPPRPSDHAGLLAFLERASHDLAEILAATPPESAASPEPPPILTAGCGTGRLSRRSSARAITRC
jgi:Mycothiol maleylpyruvate isomerase N-terminal domain